MSVGCDDTCVASFVCLLYVPLVVVHIIIIIVVSIIYSWSIPRLAIHLSHYYFFFSFFLHRKKELLLGKKNARRRAQSVGWEEARSER